MKTFVINDRMKIEARFEKARDGFNHIAVLLVDGREVERAKAHYINRTWESYEYESVVNEVIDKTDLIPQGKKQALKDYFAGKSHEEIETMFGSIGMVAKLGDIMTKNKKESNEWKKRMIKAGTGEGIDFPKNWDKIPEEAKAERLNKVIGVMMEKKARKKLLKPKIKLDVAKPDLKTLLRERYLEPQYDTRKSFYKKAKVREYKGRKVLQSYATDVAEVINGKAIVHGLYSPTTTRHIKDFLKQEGFKVGTSREIMKMYGEKEDKKAKKQLKKLMEM